MSSAYCGSALVRGYAQVAYSQLKEYTSEALLNSFIAGTLIPEVERYIDSFVVPGGRAGTRRYFNLATDQTITLDGNGKDVLWIPPKYCPPVGFATALIGGVATTVTNIKLHDQYVDFDGGFFTRGKQNIQLIGSYGYLTVPKDIEIVAAQACAGVLSDMVRRNIAPDILRQYLMTGQLQKGFDPYEGAFYNVPAVITKSQRDLLNQYRLRWVDVG